MKQLPLFITEYVAKGVDKLDQGIQYYQFSHRNRKWSFAVFIHCLAIAIYNSHILYNSTHSDKVTQKQFRISLINELLSAWSYSSSYLKNNATALKAKNIDATLPMIIKLLLFYFKAHSRN